MPEPANLPPPTAADIGPRRPASRSPTGAMRRRHCDARRRPGRLLPAPAALPAAVAARRRGACSRLPEAAPARLPAARRRSAGRCASADRRPAGRRKDPRAVRRQDRSHSSTARYKAAVEAFYAARSLRADLGRERRRKRARQGRRRLSRRRRCRRPRSGRLSGAELCQCRSGRVGRSRTQVHRDGADLCAPRPDRPRALFAGQRRHRLRSGRARARRGARRSSPTPRTSPRRSTATIRRSRLQGPQGQARRIARPHRRRRREPDRRRPDLEGRHGRSARSRRCASGSASPKATATILRQGAGRGGQEIPAPARPAADRHPQQRHRRRAQRPAPRARRRHHHRQHGAVALAAARPRQSLRDGEHPGLHPEGGGSRRDACGRPGSSPASPARRRRRCSARR